MAGSAICRALDRNGFENILTIGHDQLDLLYHDMKAGKLGVAATTGDWYVGITSVKTNFPKP